MKSASQSISGQIFKLLIQRFMQFCIVQRSIAIHRIIFASPLNSREIIRFFDWRTQLGLATIAINYLPSSKSFLIISL